MESQRSPAERYRQEAARVRGEAARARDPTVRDALLGIAQQYEALAASAEKEPAARLG